MTILRNYAQGEPDEELMGALPKEIVKAVHECHAQISQLFKSGTPAHEQRRESGPADDFDHSRSGLCCRDARTL